MACRHTFDVNPRFYASFVYLLREREIRETPPKACTGRDLLTGRMCACGLFRCWQREK